MSLHGTVHARRWGRPGPTRYGDPLEPARPTAHSSWWLEGPSGEAAALLVGDTLHLAVGRDGSGWQVTPAGLVPLAFAAAEPAELTSSDSLRAADPDRQAPLVHLRWHTVPARAGDRFLLASGRPIDPATLGPADDDEALLAALPDPPVPGFFQRLLGATASEGVALVLSLHEAPPPPDGWLPWLRFHAARGLEYHCWGTEGGGDMAWHEANAPDGPLLDTVLEVLRHHPEIDPSHLADLHANWQENGEPAATNLSALVAGSPERGAWRVVSVDELAEVFSAFASDRGAEGLRAMRALPGAMLVERLRHAVEEPVAVALHAEPIDQAVVVWFVAGGVSRASGRLELFLSERVWT